MDILNRADHLDPEPADLAGQVWAQAAAAYERTVASGARARLLATIALESRGTGAERAGQAARQAEELARGLDDPALLAFALNGVFMQTFGRAGLAPRRDELGAELVDLSARHGLITFEVLGRLIRLQARSALADFTGADTHAAAADDLAERHELPLVGVFTQWYRALRIAASPAPVAEVEAAYRGAARTLEGSGMPGLERGLLPLALLSLRVQHNLPIQPAEHVDYGPYEPWVRPLILLAQERPDEAAESLRTAPDPPHDLLFEATWCLLARAAVALGNRELMERAHRELSPAAAELAGAGSGVLTLGPVSAYLDALR